ncbi:DoxX family membrane protein [Kribbella jiaozuonensis]|uniref:DoxX family membrane protein n=1 Tax=Kribbella jiaozuonensis TaxID=2575441 RepID=A0A4U3LP43_9ACTN|nr:DoxX family membrane protein [Kribbella jiaozuonensis]TKK76107.1 DoxX family membrane protein [Kribbella jiaozuonensis]
MTTTTRRQHMPAPALEPDGDRHPTITTAAGRALGVLRIAFGLTFLWAFVDKLFGLGYATPSGKGWIDGGDPTAGFLGKGTSGPLADFYQSLVGDWWVSPLFMIGLAGIGLALTLGIGMRIAAVGGALMYLLMWSANLPPANNPVLDEHILGAITLIVLALVAAGNVWGFGRWWTGLAFVRKYPWLS